MRSLAASLGRSRRQHERIPTEEECLAKESSAEATTETPLMEEPTSDIEAGKEEPVEKEPFEEAPAAEERPTEKADSPAGAASPKSEKAKSGGCCACCTPPGSCLLSSLFTCLVAAALYYQLHMEIKEANDLINKSLRGADAVANALRQEAGPLTGRQPISASPATTGAPRNDTVQPHSDAAEPQRGHPEEGTDREAGPRSATEPPRKHQEEGAHEEARPHSTSEPQRKRQEEEAAHEKATHPSTTEQQRKRQEEGAHEKATHPSTTEPLRKHQEEGAHEKATHPSTTEPLRKRQEEEGAHEKAKPHSIGAELDGEGADEETGCHTATVTSHELCYHNVVWAKHKGIHEHPQWYPGLKESSEFEAFQEVLRIDPKMGCPRPCKDFSAAEDKSLQPTECHDTVLGERCFEHALWVMRVGLYQHPSWYPKLSNESNFAAFQNHLHDRGKGNCPKPCDQVHV